MANLSFTNVVFSSRATPVSAQLGEACSDFDVGYIADNVFYKSVCTDVTKLAVTHILLRGGALDDWSVLAELSGTATLTAAGMTQGIQYVLSATSGLIAPRSDLVTTNYIVNLFVATDASTAGFDISNTGVQVP